MASFSKSFLEPDTIPSTGSVLYVPSKIVSTLRSKFLISAVTTASSICWVFKLEPSLMVEEGAPAVLILGFHASTSIDEIFPSMATCVCPSKHLEVGEGRFDRGRRESVGRKRRDKRREAITIVG
uniref:Uncharacterized protein n=1 Tax=Manihot esculenta TaxID=3983 RepID=A0A2C9URL9_MANES